MLYIEINNHTAARRIHTEGSLKARLKALGAKEKLPQPNTKVSLSHCEFQVYGINVSFNGYQQALDTGAWGELAGQWIPCKECKETGRIEVEENITVQCWECHGRKKVWNPGS